MDIIYMLPFFLNKNGSDFIYDLKMSNDFFKSLEGCDYKLILIYNQGCFTNEELDYYLSNYNIKFKVLGNGINDGITFARHSMINFIKEYYNDTKYVAEVHLDMIFTPNWAKPLIYFLEKTKEPIVSPRIVYYEDNEYKATGKKESFIFPEALEDKLKFMESLCENRVDYGFVHPVIHRFNALKKINAYDISFLTGKQGYEDDSIILGYNYYMGTKENWVPKIYYKSCVYHKTIGQRNKLKGLNEDFEKNLIGLKTQYGAYGQKELSRIYSNNESFKINYETMLVDRDAALQLEDIKIYSDNVNNNYKNLDNYESRYILRTDNIICKSIFDIPKEWWSRFYEYGWASDFAKEEEVVLDAGCGIIHPFKYYLADICSEVHAVDLDERITNKEEILLEHKHYFGEDSEYLAIEYLDKITFKNENLSSLSYDDETFDKIFCISVLHLLSDVSLLSVLTELRRVLKNKGLLIITVDVPTIDIKKLVELIYESGLVIKNNLDLTRYNNSIYSDLFDGIYCFRILVTK